MHDFLWTGINASGQKISGKINAVNKVLAKQKLENTEIFILTIKKINSIFSMTVTKKFSNKLRLDFTQQLQLLLQSSIPLADALSLMANTSQHTLIQHIANVLKEKITEGVNFSTALQSFSDYFDNTFCQMIMAGEQSGQLDIILLQLIENQERQLQIKSKIKKALFYPLCVMGIAAIITMGLLIFVIPQFDAIYTNFGGKLPALTQYLISLSHQLNQQGLWYFIFISIIIFIIKKMSQKNKRVRNFLLKSLFKIPFFQSLMMTSQIAQWSQLLSMTLSSGIPLVDALTISNQTLSQPLLQMQLQTMRESVINGKSMYSALDRCRYFPVRAKTMIAIGENADALPLMMKKIAVLYQQQLNDSLDRLSKLLEPVIMMVVASLVSGLIIAMYLPIFRMGSVI